MVAALLLAAHPPAQAPTLRLQAGVTFTARGGRVVGFDVDDAGQRFVTLGECDDVVVTDVTGRVLGRSVLPDAARAAYVALHPVQPCVAVCLDYSRRRGAATSDLALVDTRAPLPRLPTRSHHLVGTVLAMAWNAEGSMLAVGRVQRAESSADVFTLVADGLRFVESVPVPSLLALLSGAAAVPPRLEPFAGRWRSHRSELLPKPGNDDAADPPTPSDGLLVADAAPRFARFTGGTGVGVDRLGQVFVREGERLRVHSPNRGPVLGLMFTPDGAYVAAASRGAITVGAVAGGRVDVVAGKHLLVPGEKDAELILLGQRVRRYDAARASIVDKERLPAADTGTGEDDARLYGRPQLRIALRLDTDHFVVGGYSQFGHEGLVVDVAARSVHQVADTEREADDRLIVDVHQLAQLSGTRWLARESLRAQKGEFRHTSILRAFDGKTPLWSREFTGMATAFAESPGGTHLVVADASGTLVRLDGSGGEERERISLPRPLLWLGGLDDARFLAHDGVDLVLCTVSPLREVARTTLPAGDAISATAFDAEHHRLALGRGGQVSAYEVLIE